MQEEKTEVFVENTITPYDQGRIKTTQKFPQLITVRQLTDKTNLLTTN
jgi:hypothetical protein